MIWFSIAAVVLCALAAMLILQRAAGAASRPDADPTLVLYRRQLGEIDDLAARGLLAEGELKAAKAEAARRLLGAAKAAEASPADTAPPRVSRGMRLTVLAGALAAPVLAAGLYVVLGKPGLPDQPFAARLKGWTQADPSTLGPGEMAAVLKTVAKQRPTDATPLTYLAQAQQAQGDIPGAVESIRKALRLEPKDPDLWADLGILLLDEGNGQETPEAQNAFRQAVKFEPKNPTARYHLARARIASGDVAGGLADWRALAADIPAGDPQRQQLEAQIDATAKAGRLADIPRAPPRQQQAQAGGGSAEALAGALLGQGGGGPPPGAPDPRQMVAQLEAEMQQNPNNLPGWARLIRSYAVLGEPDKMKQAQDKARQIFKGDNQALQTIDSAAAAPQGSE
jgi:cytochrome c-type biogenesis protein CcmH